MNDSPAWREDQHGFMSLQWRGCEFARVAPTVSGQRWLAHVGMHRRDHRRHHVAYRPTEEAARCACMAWWRQHAGAIEPELPRVVPGPLGMRREYPACNPMGPTSC